MWVGEEGEGGGLGKGWGLERGGKNLYYKGTVNCTRGYINTLIHQSSRICLRTSRTSYPWCKCKQFFQSEAQVQIKN